MEKNLIRCMKKIKTATTPIEEFIPDYRDSNNSNYSERGKHI